MLAKQSPKNFIGSYQSIYGTLVNEFKVGFNAPKTSATAFGAVPNYDPVGVSLSGTFTSSSIDARGNTGMRAERALDSRHERVIDYGVGVRPQSLSFNNMTTWNRGAHTFKFGGVSTH